MAQYILQNRKLQVVEYQGKLDNDVVNHKKIGVKRMKPSNEHWDNIFSDTEDSKLGWYEQDVSKSFELLNCIPEWKNSTILLTGVGTSILIEELLSNGAVLVLNDISIKAINKVKSRLGDRSESIYWLCQDISLPIQDAIPDIDIWIDRAVLHFLTDEENIKGYFKNVKLALEVGSYILFAEFSKTGASKCAGLKLHRYSLEELSEKLGSSFTLISNFDHVYINPKGERRPYIYALFKRQ